SDGLGWKFDPAISTPGMFWPCPPEFGVIEVIFGAGSRTVKALERVADWISGSVTITVRAPSGALAAIERVVLSCPELTKVTGPTVIPPEVTKAIFAPLWKFEPRTVKALPESPWSSATGLTEPIAGAKSSTAKTSSPVSVWPSGLVTVSERGP